MKLVDLLEWQETLEELRALKRKELAMRVAICEEMFKSGDLGSEKQEFVQVIDGFRVKATYTVTMSIDEDELTEIWDDLSAQEHACFNFKPVLVKSELDKLDEESAVWDVLTSKPATPTLVMHKN